MSRSKNAAPATDPDAAPSDAPTASLATGRRGPLRQQAPSRTERSEGYKCRKYESMPQVVALDRS